MISLSGRGSSGLFDVFRLTERDGAAAARWWRRIALAVFAIAITLAAAVMREHWDYFRHLDTHEISRQFPIFFFLSLIAQVLMLLFLSLPRQPSTAVSRKVSDVLFIIVAPALGIVSAMIASEMRLFSEMLAGRDHLFRFYILANLLANMMVVWYTYRIHFNRFAEFTRSIRVRRRQASDFWFRVRMYISHITG